MHNQTYSINICMNLSKFLNMRHFLLHEQLKLTSIFTQALLLSVRILDLIDDSELQFFKLDGFQSANEEQWRCEKSVSVRKKNVLG